MNTDTSASNYAARAIRALGQQANDAQRVAIWCYDNPPKKPLPDTPGTRESLIYVPRTLMRCLAAAAPDRESVHALASSILLHWINENIPQIAAMYARHEQEVEARIAELRQSEPQLEQEENPA